MEAVASDAVALSLVIPVRNRQAGLTRLLADIAADVGPRAAAVEVVIVDDASDPPVAPTDGGATALRTVLVRLDRRAGANPARLAGLRRTRAPWVHFHDSDDGIASGWFAAVFAAMAAHPNAGVLVTRRLDETGGRLLPVAQRYFERCCTNPWRIRRMLALRNCLGPLGGVIFARRALEDAHFSDQPSAQDWALYLDVYAQEPEATPVPGACFIYRRDGADRISASPRRKALGYGAIARRFANRGVLASALRLHHLHQARVWLAATRRRDAAALLRRTRVARRAVWFLVTVYAMAALRWR